MGVGSDDHSVDVPVSSVVQHATAVKNASSRILATATIKATIKQESRTPARASTAIARPQKMGGSCEEPA